MRTKSVAAVVFAVSGAIAALAGWLVWLLGPQSAFWLTGVSLLCVVLGLAAVVGSGLSASAGPPGSARLRQRLDLACSLALLLALGTALALFITCGSDGVPEFPALAEKARYELVSHGRRTPVSRTKYVVAAVNLDTALHLGLLVANLVVLYGGLFGGLPSILRGRRPTSR